MLSNVILFTGEERFLLDKELSRRKEGFVQKFGSDSVFSFDLEHIDISMIQQLLYGGGLFVNKKMIIIHGLPYEGIYRPVLEEQEPIERFIDHLIKKEAVIPEESVLVFVSNKPDKRSRFYRFLQRNATVKSFDQYKDAQLKDFVISQLPGIFIPNEVIEYFISKVGKDLYRLRFECEKLRVWCEVKHISTIDQALIDKIAFGGAIISVFDFTDALFVDNARAIQLIDRIRQDGAEWFAFVGLLYRSLKFSLCLVDFVERGITDAKDIASRMSVSPRQVSKTLSSLSHKRANVAHIKRFYTGLVELDYGIKSGKYPDTYFWLGIKKMLKT